MDTRVHTLYVFFVPIDVQWCELIKQSGGCKTGAEVRAAGQQMGFYTIYLYTPPATDAHAFPSITGMCVRWGNYIPQYTTYPGCAISANQTALLWRWTSCFVLFSWGFFCSWTITEKCSCLRWILILLSDQVFLFIEPSDYPPNEIVKQPESTVHKFTRCWGG